MRLPISGLQDVDVDISHHINPSPHLQPQLLGPPPNRTTPPTLPIMDISKLQNFGKSITSTFSPFAARTGQFVREQLGQAEDKVNPPNSNPTAVGSIATPDSTAASAAVPADSAVQGGAVASAPFSGFNLGRAIGQMELVRLIRRKLTESQTQLPSDYIELEKRVDALKQVHQQLLAVTLVSHSIYPASRG